MLSGENTMRGRAMLAPCFPRCSMPRILSLLLALVALAALVQLPAAQDAPKPETPAPGKVPPAFKKLYPQLEQRKVYAGAVQYTAETLKALKEADTKPAKFYEKRTAFFVELAENVAFRGFPSAAGDGELKPAQCGNEFLVITVPGGKIEAEAVSGLAAKHGLKLIEFLESSAAIGLRAIDCGFTEEAVRAFWVAGREVKWNITPAPETQIYTANGVETKTVRQWTGTCTTKCTEVTDAGFKLGFSYSLKSANSGRSGGGSARAYNMTAMLLTQVPIKGQYVSMQWLECLSRKEEAKLKLGEKEYTCRRFITRPRYLDESENAYETSEFWFSEELPGVPLKVERFVITGEETQTWTQEFDSTTAPK